MTENAFKKDLILIRPARESDHNFIIKTWMTSLYMGNRLFKRVADHLDNYDANYFKICCEFFDPIFMEILKSPSVSVKVACLKEDEDLLLGYSIAEEKTLYYVFCKHDWRRIGLMTDLVPPRINRVMFVTKLGQRILEKYPFIEIKTFLI